MKFVQRNAVKALVNSAALVHPDHPLHLPGEEGIKLYLGKYTTIAAYMRSC